MNEFLWIMAYIVGYAFSLGAFSKLWDVEGDGELLVVNLIIMTIWPMIWVVYLPWKLAKWIFKWA